MNAYTAQWIGKRKSQQDAYGVKHFPEGTLAVVCDGMGGHECGDLSAQIAANAFIDGFKLDGVSVTQALKDALDRANAEVAHLFAREGGFGGSTLLACFVQKGLVSWVSVGDSPLFLWRNNRLLRLNADHSMRAIYAELVPCGSLTHKEAMNQGHMLRSAVTGENIDMIDAPSNPYPLLPKDRIILSTDGTEDLLFHPSLPIDVMSMLNMREGNLAACIVDACVKINSPNADNTTVITVDC